MTARLFTCAQTRKAKGMLALVLYVMLGPKAALVELLAELLLGLALLAGGGRKRVGLVLRALLSL
jgi:hypothetical protein